MTIGKFVALLYMMKAFALLIPTHVCIFIIERCSGYEKAFLISDIAVLIPAVAYRFGANDLKVVTPLSFLSDSSLMLSNTVGFIMFVGWFAVSLLALFAVKRHGTKSDDQQVTENGNKAGALYEKVFKICSDHPCDGILTNQHVHFLR